MSKKTIGYIRVSKDEQAKEGISLDAQKDKIRRYCELHGLDLVRIAVEPGVSASRIMFAKRPAGQEIIKAIKAGEVQAVVGIKLDRFFRSVHDCSEVISAWDRAGVSIHFIDMHIDTSHAMGKFFLTIMAGIAEMEAGLIGERTKAVLDYKVSKGEYIGGQIPYGKKLAADKKMLLDDAGEQSAIRMMVRWYDSSVSVATMIRRLVAQGIPPRGQEWHRNTIRRIILRAKDLEIAAKAKAQDRSHADAA